MLSTPIVFRSCFFLLLFLPGALWAQTASQPAFWEVKQGEATVYLLGSMHFGHANFYPLPQALEEAFDRSSVLTVEVDVLHVSPTEAMQAIFKYGGLAPGQTLAQQVSPQTYQALRQQAVKSQLPVEAFDRFQPWYVALMLVEAEIRKTELQQQLGVDLHFLQRAAGKEVRELETLDSQLSLFGGFSAAEQEQFLLQTLGDLQNSQTYLMEMAAAWRAGDLGVLEQTLITPFRSNPETKALFDRIFTQRNRQMADRVLAYLKGRQTVFFVVGVGHMVGDDGIIALLEQKGVRPRRVDLLPLPSHK